VKYEIYVQQISKLLLQRNMLFPICLLLCISQIITSILLFSKKERVILVPPVLEKSMWVEASSVSPSYLEQIGIFIGNLMLTKSFANADKQGEILLRQVVPEFEGEFRNALILEATKMRKNNFSLVFYTQDVYVNPTALTTSLAGEQVSYVGEKIVGREKKKYKLQFNYRGGRLLLAGVSEEEVGGGF
jgi:conjugal transfer pilus assembly protein TraE